jgi:hypothetical protein
VCGIACLLLCVLWVRSYWKDHSLRGDSWRIAHSVKLQDGGFTSEERRIVSIDGSLCVWDGQLSEGGEVFDEVDWAKIPHWLPTLVSRHLECCPGSPLSSGSALC